MSIDRAVKTTNVLFRQMNIDLIGSAFTLKTNDILDAHDKEDVGNAQELAFKLNEFNNI